MAAVRLRLDAAKDLLAQAERYGDANGYDAMEMGLALLLAGSGLLSTRMSNVQIDEVWKQIAGLSAPLRKDKS